MEKDRGTGVDQTLVDGEGFSRFEATAISLKTFFTVVKLNWWTVLHRLKGKLMGL